MLVEALATLAGWLVGIGTGLIPGLHTNLIAATALSLAPILSFASQQAIALFIFSVALVHSFVSIIPSVFLGAPDEDTVMAVLPGHRMLLRGKAYDAVRLSVLGSALGVVCSIAIAPIFYFMLPLLYSVLKPFLGVLLIVIASFLITSEQNIDRMLSALLVFLLTGLFGLFVLDSNVKEPLLPMLSGLFGFSGLVISFLRKNSFPEQIVSTGKLPINNVEAAKAAVAATLAGSTILLFPALGPSQAAAMFSNVLRKEGSYLTMIGGVNTINILLSMISAATIGKARNGSTAAISQVLPKLDASAIALFFGAAIGIAMASYFVTLALAAKFSKIVPKLNYQLLSIGVFVFVSLLVLFVSGLKGLAVLIVGTLIGILAIRLGTSRSHCMGCLLLPTILWLVFN
ncbi:MAG: tripartite tricarboxylate transporter permease [Candidatus Woesearchaeota archaeon]